MVLFCKNLISIFNILHIDAEVFFMNEKMLKTNRSFSSHLIFQKNIYANQNGHEYPKFLRQRMRERVCVPSLPELTSDNITALLMEI